MSAWVEMSTSARLYIIALEDKGLTRDIAVLTRVVGPHFTEVVLPVIRPYRAWKLPKHFDISISPPPEKDDVVVFIEHVFPLRDIIRSPCRKVFIPNLEQLSDSDVSLSHTFCDEILHKCPDSQRVYELMSMGMPPGPTHHIIGWLSPSRKPATTPEKNWQKFLHVMGKSPVKGTTVLINLWKRHPEWPLLTIVGYRELLPTDLPDNIEILSGLSDAEIEELMYTAGIHLCPSQAEGWGHTICEALSVGSHVITTDAAPMSNMLGTTTGKLIPPLARLPFGSTIRATYPDLPWEANDFAYWNEPDVVALEGAIEEALLKKDTNTAAAIYSNAFTRYLQLRRSFEITMFSWLRRMGIDVGDTALPPISENPAGPSPVSLLQSEPSIPTNMTEYLIRSDAKDPQGRHPCWDWVIAATTDFRIKTTDPRISETQLHYIRLTKDAVESPDFVPHIQMKGDKLIGICFNARSMVLFLDAIYRIRQLSHHSSGVDLAAKLVAEKWNTQIVHTVM